MRLATEEACREYLARLRWPQGSMCPECKGHEAWPARRGLWMWRACCHHGGHPFRGYTRAPDPLVSSHLVGGRPEERHQREVKETIVGGVEPGDQSSPYEARGGCLGREPAALRAAGRSAWHAGDHRWVSGLPRACRAGLPPRPRSCPRQRRVPRCRTTSCASRRLSIAGFSRLLATHQGAVSREHLDYYLDEFTFRFNRRTSRHRGKLFYRLLEQAVAVDPVPYAAMSGASEAATRD